MQPREAYDAVVLGSGPNGLAAAITLSRSGLRTLVVEGAATAGGGARSQELTVPGVLHDVCSSVHPLALASPFMKALELERHGLKFAFSPAPLVHVLDEQRSVTLERSLDETARQLGSDGELYRRLFEPFCERLDELLPMVLGPLRLPSAPFLLAEFGLVALRSMQELGRTFHGREAPALLGGAAAHSMLELTAAASASFALVLVASGHVVGWPVARGGSQALTNALLACLEESGGEILLSRPVERLSDLPTARAYLLDVTPRQLLKLAGRELPSSYRRRLRRFRYGPGVFKLDWTLNGPIPWRDRARARAATVHLSGDLNELTASEAAVHELRLSPHPFIILVQPSLFDRERAPEPLHTAWAYCHVPNGWRSDATEVIESEVERFAPGFRDTIVARASMGTAELERYDPNYVGGDINGGLATLSQLFTRPVAQIDPYRTPVSNLFLCSSSTPPGGGVHGMCGYFAARSALKRVFGRRPAIEIA